MFMLTMCAQRPYYICRKEVVHSQAPQYGILAGTELLLIGIDSSLKLNFIILYSAVLGHDSLNTHSLS